MRGVITCDTWGSWQSVRHLITAGVSVGGGLKSAPERLDCTDLGMLATGAAFGSAPLPQSHPRRPDAFNNAITSAYRLISWT